MLPKLYIGPMSREIVDVAIKSGLDLGLIPSRRQVDHDGGYVSDTKTLVEYVRKNSTKIKIQRDHGGPSQGISKDDGVDSIIKDSENKLDLIHIDPWKAFQDIETAALTSSILIGTSLNINESSLFEVGT